MALEEYCWILILFGRLIFAVVLDHESGISNESTAVNGTVARLPCYSRTPIAGDVVYLIIWYKQPESDPICSYDNRRSNDVDSNENALWCNHKKTNGRAEFIFSDREPGFSSLLLKQVVPQDEGIYRCRVDFKKSPTRNYNVNFTVIVPPNSLEIVDDKGAEVKNGILGPFNEGSSVTITCLATGGRPSPWVTWWKENALLDDSYISVPEEGKVKNSVTISRISRNHLNSIYTCQTNNNNYSIPISSTVTLRVSLQPLSVRLKGGKKFLSSGVVYEISCIVVGAYPIPVVTWWKGNSKLRNFEKSDSSDGNVTISRLGFIPEREDNGKTLTCKVESSVYSTIPFQDSIKLNVTYPPLCSLEFGKNVNSSAIKAGVDVYFDCTIISNPTIHKVTWKHNGKPIEGNASAGILFINQSLVLQKITRQSSGLYSCVATNSEGDGESNSLYLDVKFQPVCLADQQKEYGVGRGELVKIKCQVEANPSDVEFVWKFNNSRLPSQHYTSDGTRSIAIFAPVGKLDYGQLECWASNSVGPQRRPCIYDIIAAGVPDEVNNCTLINQTFTVIAVQCDGGFDGGLPQKFLLTAYTVYDYVPIRNISESVPNFILAGLEPATKYRIEISAFNSKGQSRKIELKAFTLGLPVNEAAQFAVFLNFPALLSILFGIMLLLVLLTCAIIITVRSQNRKKRRRRKHQMIDKQSHYYRKTKENPESNPDIIPNKNDYGFESSIFRKSDDTQGSNISLITENHFKYNHQEQSCHHTINTERRHKHKHSRKKSRTISMEAQLNVEEPIASYAACDQPCPPHIPTSETPLLSNEKFSHNNVTDGNTPSVVRCCIHDTRESTPRF